MASINLRSKATPRKADGAERHQCRPAIIVHHASPLLLSTFATCAAFHSPPRAVAIPRAVRAAATTRKDVAPVALISRMIGTTLAAKRSAAAALALLPSLVATASLGPPSFLPFALAAASAAFVRCDGGQDVIAIGSRLRHLDLTFSDLALDNRGQPFVVLDRSRVQVVDVRPEPLLGLGILQLYGLLLVAYGGNQRNWDYAPRHRVAANRRPGPLSTLA